MPLLKRLQEIEPVTASASRVLKTGAEAGLLQMCANPHCRSGWLHLWRSRSGPVFEGGWNCSVECTAERMNAAVRRELEGRGGVPVQHRHRLPLGLLMMEQGWISAAQLKEAVSAQKAAGTGRLGQWLIRKAGVSEQQVTRALGLQWSCPVLPLEFHDAAAMAAIMPRLFIEAFGALPLRVAAGKLVYLGFEHRIDPVLALAIGRMSGLRVECGLVAESQFRPAHERMLNAQFPHTDLLEAASEPAASRALSKVVERERPVEALLVRVHDCLWLRLWNRRGKTETGATSVRDVICAVGSF